jgi:hypothetical protein
MRLWAVISAVLLCLLMGACAEFPGRPPEGQTRDVGRPDTGNHEPDTAPGDSGGSDTPDAPDLVRDTRPPEDTGDGTDVVDTDLPDVIEVPDTAEDAPEDTAQDTNEVCANDAKCDDGRFCNGQERCDPGHADANELGCVTGTSPRVDDDNECTLDSCDEDARTVLHRPSGCRCVGDPQDAPRDAPQCFADVAVVVGLDVGGNKDGGLLWADFNDDGWLDAATNTLDQGTQLFFQSPPGRFTPVTASHAPGLGAGFDLRSVLAADVNQDGWVDLVRNGVGELDVYLNLGADAGFRFGRDGAAHWREANPDQAVLNIEGMVLNDYNADGHLDVVVDGQHRGMYVLRNPADGTANFDLLDGTTVGFTAGPDVDGDYMVAADIDQDGDVDIVSRKTNSPDIWLLDNGQFGALNDVDFTAPNGNKGSVLLCDFDNDGDLDLFYSDGGSELRFGGATNRIYLYDGLGFIATDEPQIGQRNVDGADCADIDNDGDLDLFVTTGRADQLYINETDGELRFARHDRGILSDANGEGAAFADYDQDGDMDLWVNTDGGNHLYRNNLGGQNYLIVEPHVPVGFGRTRADHGASVWLESTRGFRISGVRTVSAGQGHGSQGPPSVHFGLPWGPWDEIQVRVRFVGTTTATTTTVTPADLGGYQRIRIVRP